MSELLLASELDFRALIRRSSSSVTMAKQSGVPADRIISCSIISGDMLEELHRQFPFTHVFNFAANSFVQDSSDYFRDYIDANSGITWEILKFIKRRPDTWLMQPLSCEVLSDTPRHEADIARCLAPRNAYGVSKLVDLHCCAIERAVSGLRILSPIVYNHESRLRPSQFFSRKLVAYLQGGAEKPSALRIFNTASVRDWGSAPEYMSILFQAASSGLTGSPLLGTGHGLSVEAFVDHAIAAYGVVVDKWVDNGLMRWKGEGLDIVECDRDPDDAARIVIANRAMVGAFFGCAPDVHGAELVRQLVHDVI
ncbi:MAG: GDP-mannose 4,6-dehydratase [Chromatiaceae bacterium]|nr:GDP-mannose 4,6-dehydratase [Chromatiaceae bacterium]